MTAEDLAALEQAFVQGFRAAPDRQAFLRLAGIPFVRSLADGTTACLVAVRMLSETTVGTVAPGFAGGDLVHHPLPDSMMGAMESVIFRYRSRNGDVDLTFGEVQNP